MPIIVALRRFPLRLVMALVLVAGLLVATIAATTTSARADGCYTWTRTLSQGASGRTFANCRSVSPAIPDTGSICRSTASSARTPRQPSGTSRPRTGCPPTASPARRRSTRSTSCKTTTARRSTSRTARWTTAAAVADSTAERCPSRPREPTPCARCGSSRRCDTLSATSRSTSPARSGAIPATRRSAAPATASTSTARPPT